MTYDLKSCPFCGRSGFLKIMQWEVQGILDGKRYICGCWTPSCRGFVHKSSDSYHTKGAAIRQWNKRVVE